jgi:hypothetical protein
MCSGRAVYVIAPLQLAAPEYRTAARQMAAAIAQRDGREVAVDALESLLHATSA